MPKFQDSKALSTYTVNVPKLYEPNIVYLMMTESNSI